MEKTGLQKKQGILMRNPYNKSVDKNYSYAVSQYHYLKLHRWLSIQSKWRRLMNTSWINLTYVKLKTDDLRKSIISGESPILAPEMRRNRCRERCIRMRSCRCSWSKRRQRLWDSEMILRRRKFWSIKRGSLKLLIVIRLKKEVIWPRFKLKINIALSTIRT